MNECMGIDKPLISIVMAVYEPNMQWLKEQLLSLEAQTYPNLELIIRDDCSPNVPFEQICECAATCIRSFPYEISRNERNVGSNQTFEWLTQQARGEYIAYCDQDDVWLSEKIETLYQAVLSQNAVMSYCDMAVIDAKSDVIATSLRQIRPRLEYLTGSALMKSYFFRNCTAGCSMLIRSDMAKQAIPFPKQTVADHWLAIWAAHRGTISFVEQILMQYRQHLHNQTGILTGVFDKASYRAKRLLPLEERLRCLSERTEVAQSLQDFVRARLDNRISGIWKGRKFSRKEAEFEIAMNLMPDKVFQRLISRIRR